MRTRKHFSHSKARKLTFAAATGSVIGLAALGASYIHAAQAAEPSRAERAIERHHDGASKHMRGGMQHRRGGGPGDFGQHIEGHLAFLKTELHITESQTQVWDQFAETLRSMNKEAAEKREEMKAERESQAKNRTARRDQTLMQRFERSEARLEAMIERQKKLKTAVEPLYAALSDDQKKLADKLLRFNRGGRR